LSKRCVFGARGTELTADGVDEVVALCDISFKGGDVFCGELVEIEET
jgi:hypothetical protein